MQGSWQPLNKLSFYGIAMLALSGLCTGLSWLCYFRALQLGQVSKVAPVDKLSVVFAIIFSVIFLSEKLTWKIAIGGGLISAGAVILAL